MADRLQCEFSLIRYVPDVVKGEFVNIGVLLCEADAPAQTRVRFTRDWSRVRCVDEGADLALLEAMEEEITARLQGESDSQALLTSFESSLSNSIQITQPRAALAENLTTELEHLMRLYVEPMQRPRPPANTRKPASGRTAIHAAMRTEFERAGVWGLMNKRIAAERYTRKGDPLRVDCGYRRLDKGSGNTIRMFQAISLAGEAEMAKVLAFTAAQMHDGVSRVEGAALDLTAVVEPLRALSEEEGETAERYHFGVETLEQREIRVVTLNDLARVAASARYELNL